MFLANRPVAKTALSDKGALAALTKARFAGMTRDFRKFFAAVWNYTLGEYFTGACSAKVCGTICFFATETGAFAAASAIASS